MNLQYKINISRSTIECMFIVYLFKYSIYIYVVVYKIGQSYKYTPCFMEQGSTGNVLLFLVCNKMYVHTQGKCN
jgi:hypothetical protein